MSTTTPINLPTVSDLLPKPLPSKNTVPQGMRKFTIYRHADESGVSGVGTIIQGVLLADGKCVIQWLQGPDPGDTQVKQDFTKFINTHISSHPTNYTVLTWEDGEQEIFGPAPQETEK